MTPAAFIDANIPVYVAGGEHTLKQPCGLILQLVAAQPAMFATDAKVLQELLHFYLARGRWGLGRAVVRDFAEVMQGADFDRVSGVERLDPARFEEWRSDLLEEMGRG